MPHPDSGGRGRRDGTHTASTADLADARPAGFDADATERPPAPFNDALPASDPSDPAPSHRPPELDAASEAARSLGRDDRPGARRR